MTASAVWFPGLDPRAEKGSQSKNKNKKQPSSLLCVFLQGHLSLLLKPTLIIQNNLISSSSITPAQTLCPNKATFTDSGG